MVWEIGNQENVSPAFGQSSNSPFGSPSGFGQPTNNTANNNPFGAQQPFGGNTAYRDVEKHMQTFCHREEKKAIDCVTFYAEFLTFEAQHFFIKIFLLQLPSFVDWFGWYTLDAFYTYATPEGDEQGLRRNLTTPLFLETHKLIGAYVFNLYLSMTNICFEHVCTVSRGTPYTSLIF